MRRVASIIKEIIFTTVCIFGCLLTGENIKDFLNEKDD